MQTYILYVSFNILYSLRFRFINFSFMNQQKLMLGAFGIFASYLTTSYLLEKLYSTHYQSAYNSLPSQMFKHPILIVWLSSMLCTISGFFIGKLKNEKKNPLPLKEKILLGLLNTTNMITANQALLYITYLQETIARNSRYLFVVMVGAYLSRVKKTSKLKLTPKKVVIGVLITIGVIAFTIESLSQKHNNHLDPDKNWIGYVLIGISIIADAFFSDSQAYSKSKFQPSLNHLFFSASSITFILSFTFSIIKGQLLQQLQFCYNYPSSLRDIFGLAGLQVVGQLSIYYVVVNFKQHMFPLIATTRKVCTVLLSIFIFGHKLKISQWGSLALVFGGLSYEIWEQVGLQKKKNK